MVFPFFLKDADIKLYNIAKKYLYKSEKYIYKY